MYEDMDRITVLCFIPQTFYAFKKLYMIKILHINFQGTSTLGLISKVNFEQMRYNNSLLSKCLHISIIADNQYYHTKLLGGYMLLNSSPKPIRPLHEINQSSVAICHYILYGL